jgi:hypothetical protein
MQKIKAVGSQYLRYLKELKLFVTVTLDLWWCTEVDDGFGGVHGRHLHTRPVISDNLLSPYLLGTSLPLDTEYFT